MDIKTHSRRYLAVADRHLRFNWSEVKWIWIAMNIRTGITWNFVIAHLLGMCARFDRTGQAAVWSGFASKMGLASGPMLASLIVGAGNYSSGDRVGCRTAELCVACGGVAGMGARPWRRWLGEPVHRNASIDDHLAVTSVSSLLLPSFHCFRIGSRFRCIRSTPTVTQVGQRERLRVFWQARE